MDAALFRAFYAAVESKPTSDAKIKEIRARVGRGGLALTCSQVGEIEKLINFANLRVEVAEILGPFIADWDEELGKRELLFQSCKPWERDDLTRAIERGIFIGGNFGRREERVQHKQKHDEYASPEREDPFSKQNYDIEDGHRRGEDAIDQLRTTGVDDDETAKRNCVIMATEAMNAGAKKEHIFSFNMEWLDVNSTNVGETMSEAVENGNTFFPGQINDPQWRKKTPMERLKESKWVPPALAGRGVTEEEFVRLCDILISAFQTLPFQSCGRQGCSNPGCVEILYFCFPLGPLCMCLQMMNPYTCMIYTPFEEDIKRRVLPAMNDILRRCNLKAIKPGSFRRNIVIVENS